MEYRKAALLGDTIIPRLSVSDGTYTVVLSAEDEKPYALVELRV